MNLTHLADEALHLETGKIIKQERKLLINMIHLLRENNRRRLYSAYKCESLKDYLVFIFGYSEDEAWRRIDVIKLLEDIPELESKIESGAHCLTNLNLAHALFKKEAEFAKRPFTREEKLDILEFIERMPTRKVKRIILGFSTAPKELMKEKVHHLTMDKLANDEDIQIKIKKLKGLVAHSHPGIDELELVRMAFEVAIRQLDPAQKTVRKYTMKKRAKSNGSAQIHKYGKSETLIQNENGPVPTLSAEGDNRGNVSSPHVRAAVNATEENEVGASRRSADQGFTAVSDNVLSSTSAAPRTISPAQTSQAETHRTIWRRAQSQCENCGSSYALQIEHIVPQAYGGTDELCNLKLLCRSCNQRTAIEVFGVSKMQAYLN